MTTDNAAPSYILRYFPVAALAETSRLLLTAAKADWKEENPEWPAEKPNQPFGRLPVLIEKGAEDDGSDFVLSESATIERYLARTFGFIPTDLKQAARQEQFRDQHIDIITAFFVSLKSSEAAREEMLENFNEMLDKIIELQTNLVRNNARSNYLFGSSLSYADMVTYAFYRLLFMYAVTHQAAIGPHVASKLTPEIKTFLGNMDAEPMFEKHLSSSGCLAPYLATK
ncbi:hypothetical protein GGI04_001268 [Coemansia thaxteri]|uniref:Glutathione S-transferase n=1 Tax=Coemansia thaxteri TaxID=2663907 RepID=A0A9W8BIN0_9FUNG|nr:hypothetical protein H4R26_003154 [Coemansia thaxteri]KAJ2008089.1 hypothetical protein GGI04_001268 [Coemansia thaxteri]KAJ2472338.1 hypothetical protein GGI02_001650 [Coemansia sp. RSA 2322]